MLNEPPKRRIPLILHVDDDKAQAETLKSILEGSGFLVLQASTAEDALRLFKEEPAISLVTRVMAALSWRCQVQDPPGRCPSCNTGQSS